MCDVAIWRAYCNKRPFTYVHMYVDRYIHCLRHSCDVVRMVELEQRRRDGALIISKYF